MSDLVGYPENRFSHDATHLSNGKDKKQISSKSAVLVMQFANRTGKVIILFQISLLL